MARIFPRFYDFFLAPWEWLGLPRWRARLVAPVTDRVLEVGAGTGLNLPHYREATQIVLTDYDFQMLAVARERVNQSGCQVFLVVADAVALPFRASTFDNVIATLAFCTIEPPDPAFAQIRRVLTRCGRLHLLEHVRTQRERVGRLQDALTPAWQRVAHGCHLNRRTLETAREQGFLVEEQHCGLTGWLCAVRLSVRPVTQ